MVVTGERLSDFEEASHSLHELVEIGAAMIAHDDIAHGFPESFDGIGPGMTSGLEQEPDAGMVDQPDAHQTATMNSVVVEHALPAPHAGHARDAHPGTSTAPNAPRPGAPSSG